MIESRHRDFVDSHVLDHINQELYNSPGWVFRTNFWRYYLAQGITPYNEADPATWYGNQRQAMNSVAQPWQQIFDKVQDLAGHNFVIMRYALTGQTQAQHQTLHRDVSLNLRGCFRSYLLYLNAKWNQNYGGSTDFADSQDVCHQEWPEPGKLVVFHSQVLHCGNPPTVPNVLRISMVIHGQLV